MFAPLLPIKIASIYNGDLPKRLARCTADMTSAVLGVVKDLGGTGNELVLSDMYRSHDMQFQAYMDYKTGKKSAFSPPPGGSMHEAGRAFDLDLARIRSMGLAAFWPLAQRHGLTPIIDTPSAGKSEAWHFDCRGSHDLVYQYYKAGRGDNFASPYTAMAASAIVSTGQTVDKFGNDPRTGYIQSGLVRLGQIIGDIDGQIGPKTNDGLAAIGIDASQDIAVLVTLIDRKLQAAFPAEYFVQGAVPESLEAGALPVAAGTAAATGPAAGQYQPDPRSIPLLKRIAGALSGATPVTQSFSPMPRFVATLPSGELYFDSELQLDTDGWPDGDGAGDDSWNPDTSLTTRDGRAIDANKVPYFVLPLPAGWSAKFGISLGDYAAVIFRDRLGFAVFADQGPKNKIGEGSLALLRALGAERLRADGTVINAGMGPGVITIVFPGSGAPAHRADEATLLRRMETIGQQRLANIA